MTFHIHANWLGRVDDARSNVAEPAEDSATLAEIKIVATGVPLTEAMDSPAALVRRGPNLSAYQLAQWLAWHWWRMRWETRAPSCPIGGGRWHGRGPNARELNWHAAHNLGELGDGWLWPMVTFESDGARMAMQAAPSTATPAEPLRFLGSQAVVLPVRDWEHGVEDLVGRVLGRLAACGLTNTDLNVMWRELENERADPELATYRRIEARLGFDVDDADPKAVERIHKAGASLGHAAMLEAAANGPATARDFTDAARAHGLPSSVADRPSPIGGLEYGERKAPWRVGVEAARHLREREGLGAGPMLNRRLTGLCALPTDALERRRESPPMAFSLEQRGKDRIVLRSKWQAGRRFEAARLLGDALVVDAGERLRPATTAATYRQKMQRAFAAEFLCPIESLMDYLDADFSDEAQQQAAERFKVSPLAVASQLANNGFLHETRDLDVAA